jgi:hypothetical protein
VVEGEGELIEVLQTGERVSRELPREVVVGEVEREERREAGEVRREGADEVVAGEVESLEASMRLSERSRYTSPEQLVKSGSAPEILLFDRSSHRTAPTPTPTIHRSSPSPEILLLDKSSESSPASPEPLPAPPPGLAAPTPSPERLRALKPPQAAVNASTSATAARRPAFPDRSSVRSLGPHLHGRASVPLTLASRRLSSSRAASCSSVAAMAWKSALSGTPASDSDVSLPSAHSAPGNLQAPPTALQRRRSGWPGIASLNCSSSWTSSAATAATKSSASTVTRRGDSMDWRAQAP